MAIPASMIFVYSFGAIMVWELDGQWGWSSDTCAPSGAKGGTSTAWATWQQALAAAWQEFTVFKH